jgi:hypothetical protein
LNSSLNDIDCSPADIRRIEPHMRVFYHGLRTCAPAIVGTGNFARR